VHPGAAADQDQGGGQAQHDAGVDAEFEQGVTQCAGGFVPGQGQSGADGADLPGGTDDPDDQKGLELEAVCSKCATTGRRTSITMTTNKAPLTTVVTFSGNGSWLSNKARPVR